LQRTLSLEVEDTSKDTPPETVAILIKECVSGNGELRSRPSPAMSSHGRSSRHSCLGFLPTTTTQKPIAPRSASFRRPAI